MFWNLVSHIQGRMQAEGVQEQSAEKKTWTYRGGCNTGLEESVQWEAPKFELLTKYYSDRRMQMNEMSRAYMYGGGEVHRDIW
jgi:hypothetical protein